MNSVSVWKLRVRLGHYVRLVKAGESIVVTERGKASAMLVPPRSSELQDLIEAGVVRRAAGQIPPEIFQPFPVNDPEGLLMKGIIADPCEGR